MDIERRAFLALSMLMMSGCASAAPKKPAKLAGWDAFKTQYVLREGRIADSGNGGISHSEGQGYGMLLAEITGDRDMFDRLHGWTERALVRPHEALFSWRFEPGKGVTDPNNATDGDILIAWALMRAAVRWRDMRYSARAKAIRAAIHGHLVRKQGPRTVLLPGLAGFDHGDRATVNLSYYIWPALDAFRAADGADLWAAVIADGEKLVVEARAGPLELPTDWTDIDADGHPKPAADKPPRFGFDAIRIPLYLSLGNRRAGAETIARFWRSYAEQGKPIPAWVDVKTGEVAPYPLSDGGYAVVRRLLGDTSRMRPAAGPADYYSTVLKLLAQIS